MQLRAIRNRRTRVMVLATVIGLILSACDGHYARRYTADNDYVYNFDNMRTSRGTFVIGSSNSDFPVTMVFYGPGITIQKVKGVLDFIGATEQGIHLGDEAALRLRDYPASAEFDADGGSKKIIGNHWCGGPRTSSFHIHLYGGTVDNRMFSSAFFNEPHVFATTHRDNREGCGDQWFGDSDNVETYFRNSLANAHFEITGFYPMANNIDGQRSLSHRWQSDGWATVVYIP